MEDQMLCKGTIGRVTSTTNNGESKPKVIDKVSNWGTLEQRWGRVKPAAGHRAESYKGRTVSPALERQTPNQPLEQ